MSKREWAQRAAQQLDSTPQAYPGGVPEGFWDDLVAHQPETALAMLETGTLPVARNVRLSAVGLEIAEAGITFDDWQLIGALLVKFRKAYWWAVRDWLAYGERAYGETYQEIAELLGYNIRTLYNGVSIAKSIHISRRREALFPGHHSVVASLVPDQQIVWLDKAEQGQWSVQRLRKEVHQALTGYNPPALSRGPLVSFRRFLQESEEVLTKHKSRLGGVGGEEKELLMNMIDEYLQHWHKFKRELMSRK